MEITVAEIADFFTENCVVIEDWGSIGFSVHCAPDEIYVSEKPKQRPFPVSREFFEGVIFAKYDFFIEEVKEMKAILEGVE